jgi:hypothetical protein
VTTEKARVAVDAKVHVVHVPGLDRYAAGRRPEPLHEVTPTARGEPEPLAERGNKPVTVEIRSGDRTDAGLEANTATTELVIAVARSGWAGALAEGSTRHDLRIRVFDEPLDVRAILACGEPPQVAADRVVADLAEHANA